MKEQLKKRTITIARHVVKTHDTVRECSKIFGISKSTVHNDLSKRLKKINLFLYLKVKKILKFNFSQKHIRGGIATENKYKKISLNKEKY